MTVVFCQTSHYVKRKESYIFLIFRTCVKFYSAADEINATALKEHCSGLISAHWDDLTGSYLNVTL